MSSLLSQKNESRDDSFFLHAPHLRQIKFLRFYFPIPLLFLANKSSDWTIFHFIGVWVGHLVSDGRGVLDGVGVRVIVGDCVGIRVRVEVGDMDGIRLGVNVGGSPYTRNSPNVFHSIPTKKIT